MQIVNYFLGKSYGIAITVVKLRKKVQKFILVTFYKNVTVDEVEVDEMGVDEMGSIGSGNKPYLFSEYSRY